MELELWEVTNQAKVFCLKTPEINDVRWIAKASLDSFVPHTLGGSGIYSPELNSYLVVAKYQMTGDISWTKC